MQMKDDRQMTIKVRYLPKMISSKTPNCCSPNTRRRSARRSSCRSRSPTSPPTTSRYGSGSPICTRPLGIPMLRDQPDILGAIWVDDGNRPDRPQPRPEENPSMLGRYRFSVGHEIGHWRLHRSYVAKDADQSFPFRRAIRADRDLPLQPGKGTDRMAGRLLLVVPADASPPVHDEWKDVPGPHRAPLLLRICDPTARYDARADLDLRAGRNEAARSTMRCSRTSPNRSPGALACRRAACASGWKSLGCCSGSHHGRPH